MDFALNLRKILVIALAGLALTACATQKKSTGMLQGDSFKASCTTLTNGYWETMKMTWLMYAQ